MRIRPDQLVSSLQSGNLAPLYLISGDEPLQMTESADSIRRVAKTHGYEERVLLEVTRNFDWNTLFQEADTLSLFTSKKLIELRLGAHKPGTQGSKALVEYCENPPQDTVLLITTGKIDSSSQKNKWFKALENTGVVIQIWPVDARSLSQWIVRRFAMHGRRITDDAADYIADHVEGNLLAASQEIENILLLTEKETLNLTDVIAVGDNTRYDVFKLVDTILEGHKERVIRILDGLRNEGVEPIIVHWALNRELHSLYSLASDVADGLPIDNVMKKHRVWSNRKNPIRTALQRHKPRGLQRLITSAIRIEKALKGVGENKGTDPWIAITWLSMRMAGIRLDQDLLKTL